MDCPKCKQPLAPSGIANFDGEQLTVYQCDTCTRFVNFGGQEFEAALTFAVNPAGQLFDPESHQPLNLN